MTAYTIHQLEQLAAGQGTRNIQECSQTRSVKTVDFRVDIRHDIYDAVIRADRALTRNEIAKAVGRKKSTWFNERIEDCVTADLLVRYEGYWKNGVLMFWYDIADR